LGAPPIKPQHKLSETVMAGIGVIILFLAAFLILNRIEFGRFD
jgi:hypothetical protein